jgi:hypothetical protein
VPALIEWRREVVRERNIRDAVPPETSLSQNDPHCL